MWQNVDISLAFIAEVALIYGGVWVAVRLAKKWAKNPALRVLLAVALSVVFSGILLTAAAAGCTAFTSRSNGGSFHTR